MKLFKHLCLGIACLSMVFCTSGYSVRASEDEIYLDGEYLTFDVQEENGERHVYAYNRNGEVESHVVFINDTVYEEDETGNLTVMAYIETDEPQVVETQTWAVEPNWGPMLSQRTRVSFPNPQSSALVGLTGLIIGKLLPGASIPYTVATIIAEYVMNYNQQFIDQTCYFREASGCPQYRWYDRYEYRNQSGALFKTVTLNKKSFIGVTNSPENPPACRMYGF